MQKNLQQLRQEIDQVDEKIVQLLAQRMQIIVQVAEFKRKHNLPALAQDRWNQVLMSKKQIGQKLGLAPQFIEKIFSSIHEFSLRLQSKK